MAYRLDVANVRKIVPGTSTRAEVERIFGQPDETLSGADGKLVARYYYRQPIVSTEASRVQRHDHPGDLLLRTLTVRYNSSGTVERKLHDESITPVRRSDSGWVEIGPDLDPAAVSRIEKGKTTAAELLAQLREPASQTLDVTGARLLVWFYYKDRLDRLGQPVARELLVVLNDKGAVADYVLRESNTMKSWWWWR